MRNSRLTFVVVVLSLASAACTRPARSTAANVPEGLWDAHTHLSWWGPDVLDSLQKYGGVGVRDLGGDAIELKRWRDEIARGARRGPRIFLAGPQLDGLKENMKNRALVSTEVQARRVVDSLADLGVDYIKVHNAVKPNLFFIVLRDARVRHLRVVAHLPVGVPAWVAADYRAAPRANRRRAGAAHGLRPPRRERARP